MQEKPLLYSQPPGSLEIGDTRYMPEENFAHTSSGTPVNSTTRITVVGERKMKGKLEYVMVTSHKLNLLETLMKLSHGRGEIICLASPYIFT